MPKRGDGERSLDVLRGARVCASLAEALQGTVYALAVSARRRELAYVSADARAAAQALLAAAQEGEVAIVFGTEMSGLTNEEILQCRAAAHIPADPGYSSLNLAAAVQVLAYEARVRHWARKRCPRRLRPARTRMWRISMPILSKACSRAAF